MIEAPLELVWEKWRKTYRSRWAEAPPARKITSMSIMEREQVDTYLERVKVCVQFGPRSYETAILTFADEEKSWWLEIQREMGSPKGYYTSLDADARKHAMAVWSPFEDWVNDCTQRKHIPGEHEVSLRLLAVIQKMKAAIDNLKRPTMLCWYLALKHSDYSPEDNPVVASVFECLIGMMAVLGLYRECAYYARRRAGEGYDGGPRNVWEEKNGLSSAAARAEFAKSRMINYGFLDGD